MRQAKGEAERPTLPPGSLTGVSGSDSAENGLIERLRDCRSEIDGALREALAGAGRSDAGARRAVAVEMLVAGEALDPATIDYSLEGSHLAMVTNGAGVDESIREATERLGCDVLLVERDDAVWAWVGGPREEVLLEAIGRAVSDHWPAGRPVGIGEPSSGLSGWRSSHQQAAAALSIASIRGGIAWYSDVALLASVSGDDLLTTSLRRNYLAPLERERNGGEVLRGTLRAYFGSGRNVSATAAGLGVSRNTVGNRIRSIESKTGRPLADFTPEYEAALRLDGLSRR